ncbi:hypothetical protein NBRC116494_27400 [Aurantivibrio plasticivorans]
MVVAADRLANAEQNIQQLQMQTTAMLSPSFHILDVHSIVGSKSGGVFQDLLRQDAEESYMDIFMRVLKGTP